VRPVFTKPVASLIKTKKASGIIIHKIDRGARNCIVEEQGCHGEPDKVVGINFGHRACARASML
jgi:hypothetical protein